MAKRLNYQIGITADTAQFNTSIQQAFEQLNRLGQRISIVPTLREASQVALELRQNLAGAFDTTTGKLDLTAFENSINRSGRSLHDYYQQLNRLGPAGREAFLSVAQSITSAELPLKRTNKLMNDLWITMKNTARWQLTSSALHGFVGQLQTAYGYAKRLDGSLNDIRIVTSKTADEMKQFAAYANEAARALSTTTTNYTDASLIYYQQGLNEQQVKDRTETTIKMANVSRQDAEETSQQLTAIWNNFYNGSKSLEYYADVMARLGAETASSSAEIAEGIQKFAAAAGAVGLSYEYAATALATLTANTRESASVVGTALRTLFTRFQGLSLGETLEDGIDLNKYSTALAKVGIQIQDASGNLKQMDVILDETAKRWVSLSEAQRLALAQTVAGVRQYTQFVGLMDNWGDFQKNLQSAYGSSGTLQEQADIYAESWEAARDRVRASAEDIYDSLINPDFFIKLDDSISPILTTFATMMDALGGMSGALSALSLAMNKVYGDRMAQSIRNMANNIGLITNNDRERGRLLREQAAALAQNIRLGGNSNDPRTEAWARLVELQGRADQEAMKLTQTQAEILQNDMQHLKNLQEQVDMWEELARTARTQATEAAATASDNFNTTVGWENRVVQASEDRARASNRNVRARGVDTSDEVWDIVRSSADIDEAYERLRDYTIELTRNYRQLDELNTRIQRLSGSINGVDDATLNTLRTFDRFANISNTDLRTALQATDNVLTDEIAQIRNQIDIAEASLAALGNGSDAYDRAIRRVIQHSIEAEQQVNAQADAIRLLEEELNRVSEQLNNQQYATVDFADRIVAASTMLSSITGILSSLQGTINIFSNEDATNGEKIIATLTMMSMILPAVIELKGALALISTGLVTIEGREATVRGISTTATLAKATAERILAKAQDEQALAQARVNAAAAAGLITLAPYIAAATALVAVIYLVVKAYNAEANAAKKAASAARETADAANEAKEAADQLRSSIDAYDSAVNKLEECTRGTEEWRDALKEVNKTALEVLSNAGKISLKDLQRLKNEDGTLNREALSNLQDRVDNRSSKLSYASSIAEKNSADASIRAQIASQLGVNRSSSNIDIIEKELFKLANVSERELVSILHNIGITADGWENAIKDMANTAEAASEKFNLISQIMVEEQLDLAMMEDSIGQAISTTMTTRLENVTENLVNEWQNKLTGSGINKLSTSSNTIYQETLAALQAAGYDVSAAGRNAVRGTDSERMLAFLNSAGEEVVYRSEQIASMIAAAQALDGLTNASEQLQVALTNLDENAIGYIASGNFSEVRRTELGAYDSVAKARAQFGGLENVKEIIAAQKGIGIDEVTNALVSEFLNGIVQASKDAEIAIQEAANNQYEVVQKAYEKVLKSDALAEVSAKTAKGMVQLLGDTFVHQGAEALSGLTNIISGLGNSADEFFEVVQDINWEYASVENVRDALDDVGITSDQISNEALPQLIEWMQRARDVSLNAAQEFYNAFKEISNSIENNASTLTQEQITTLADAGVAVDSYFTKLADGTYALAEDADKLKGIIDSIAMRDLYLASENALQKYQQAKQVSETGLNRLDSYQKIDALQATGNLSSEDALGLTARLGTMEEAEGATKEIARLFKQASLDSQDIENALKEASKQASEIQKAINDTQFRNDVERFNLDLDETERYAKQLAKELKADEKAARDFAIANQRLDRGLGNVNDNLEDYSKNLKASNKGTAEYSKTLTTFKEDLADIFNLVDADLMPDDFAEGLVNGGKYAEDFKLALDGDIEAYNRLRMALSETLAFEIKEGMTQGEDESDRNFKSRCYAYATAWENVKALLADGMTTGSIQDESFITSLNQMIKAADMSYEQITSLLGSMGVSAKIKTDYKEQEVTVPQSMTEQIAESGGEYETTLPDGSSFKGELTRIITRTVPLEPYTTTGFVPVYSVETASGDTTSGGNIDIKVNKAPNISKGSTTSGRASKKGGSSKQAKKVESKTSNAEPDRYHRINRVIEAQADLLEEVGTQVDRAYGSSKLKLFTKQQAELNQQIANQNIKLEEAEYWLDQDKIALQDFLAEGGNSPAIFDADGEIENFNQLEAAELAHYEASLQAYNAYLDKYNAMTAEEQEAVADEFEQKGTQFEDAEERWSKWQEYISQYEETLDVVNDQQQTLIDQMREMADLKLQEIDYKLEIVLDAKSMKNAVQEFWKQFYEVQGDYLSHFKQTEDYGKQLATSEVKIFDDYLEKWQELQDLANDPYADQEAIMDDIQELQSQILESANSIVEWANSIEEIIPEAVKAAADRFAQFTDQLDHNTSVLETIKELYALQGVTNKTASGFNTLQRNLTERLEAQTANAVLQKKWSDEAEQRLAQAQRELDNYLSAGGAENNEYDRLKKARDAYLQEFNDAQEAYLSLAKEAMETAQEMYLEQIERAKYEFGQSISGGLGLDLLQDKYDHYIEAEERYLDKVNEAYQVSSWYNKLQADIDNATNASTRERLKALQEEIDLRREGGTLSQYDLDILEAKYEVMQAQIALEEAQNAKNNLQLVRDSQGNWNYQYTADQSQIESAEQNLLDAQNNWYNIAKEQVTNVTGEIVSLWQECSDEIEAIYTDMTLTDQERADRAAEIYAYYTEKVKYLETEKQVAVSDMTQAGNESLIANAIITGDTISDITGLTSEDIQKIVEESGASIIDILSGNNETIQDIVSSNTELIDLFENVYAEDLDKMTDNTENFEDELNRYLDQCEEDFEDYQEKVETVADETGTTLEELAEETDTVSEATDELRERGEDAAIALWEQVDAAAALSAELSLLAQEYLAVAAAMAQVAGEQANFVDSRGDADDYGSGTFDPNAQYANLMAEYLANGGSTSDAAYQELLKQRDEKIEWLKGQGYGEDYYGSSGEDTIKHFEDLLQNNKDRLDELGDLYNDEEYKEWLEKLKIPMFDTGGYTGDFENAKLAFLHKKELVLNQEDTNNILAAVQAVRSLDSNVFASIEKALDGSVSAGMSLMKERLGGYNGIQPLGDTLQQEVRIEAVFPNATDRNEIAEAFNNLVNDASQYIRRRRD